MKRIACTLIVILTTTATLAGDPVVDELHLSGPVVSDQGAVGEVVIEGEWVEDPAMAGTISESSTSILDPHVCHSGGGCRSDIMQVRNYTLLDYRRMFKHGRTPTSADLVGTWKGVNKGIVRLVGLKQFIKEIKPCGSVMFGDNIDVHQVSDQMLRCCGWQPKVDRRTGLLKRNGKYMVQPPTRRGHFGHGVVFSYRDGGNRRGDFRRVIVDKVVMVDCNHLLGRASVRIGLVQIPVGYFVLERMH